MWNICLVAEYSFCRVANERTGLWQGLGSMALLPCLTCYNQPSHLLFSLLSPPWTWSISSLRCIFRQAMPHLTSIHGSEGWHDMGKSQACRICIQSPNEEGEKMHLNEHFWFCCRCGLLVSARHRAHKEREGRNGPLPLLIQGHHWHPWKGPPEQQEGG